MDDGTRRFCIDMRDRFDEVTSVPARKAVARLAEAALDADAIVQRLRREAESRYVSCCDCVAWKGRQTVEDLDCGEEGVRKHVVRECRNWPASSVVSRHIVDTAATIWTRTPDCGGSCYGIRIPKEGL